LGPASIRYGVLALGQAQGFTVSAVNLRLKEEIRSQTLGGIGIEPAQFVPHDEGRHDRISVLVVYAQRDRMRRECGKENCHVIAKAYILRSLTYVETDDGRSLAGVATVNGQDLILNRQPREAWEHRWILVQRNVGPAVRSLFRGKLHGGLGVFCGLYVHVSRVWTLHLELCRHPRLVDHLDQKDPGSRFDQLRPGSAALNFCAALGINLKESENVRVQNAL